MTIKALVQLSESDKRILFAVLIAFVLIFVIIGLIGKLITRIMKQQGKRIDGQVSDVLTTFVITERKKFIPYARKKNYRLFFKQSWIPLTLIIMAVALLLIADGINKDFSYNPFNKDDGFGTLFFIWDFSDQDSYTYVFGIKLLAKWPPLVASPHLVKEAWLGYVFVPFVIVGGIWYLIDAQCLIARTIRIYQIANKNLGADLDNFNQGNALAKQPMSNQQNSNEN